MTERIQTLLEEASEKNAESPDFRAWSHAALVGFPIKAYTDLRSFQVERFDYPEDRGHEFRLRPHKALLEETTSLAGHAWRALGGSQVPEQGLQRAGLASIENVRAQLRSVLWIGSRLNIYRTYRPEAARHFTDSVLAIDWHDAEAVLKANFQAFTFLGVLESSADNLYDWAMTINRPEAGAKELELPSPDAAIQAAKPQEIMSGAALLALDAALATGDWQQSLGLMSFAANATWQAGWISGWEGREELWREEAKHAGKKGGTQRHQASRALKLWALSEAVALRGSDMDIARQLVLQIPARLQDASADPERLIYDALRNARKSERQEG
ncbi:hypothetical protein APR50_37545 [Variovorax paradoxus]|jgi:hypothetical protein|uniref:hypothetical protein n=1 Tax=Variovorax TaxID=34072 RepID=UPI0006E587CE|nr:hypothetical protein [Variovorax sp.]KPU94628.1 hypothetical protein APR50_37545 [Variovorax paradoxus]KPU94949.1 hypothetical protein APR52_19375 [Variovorax paradoxus]KPU96173.1 hypothetical protein APR49_36870 [Variovorax paradoxus]KPV15110.1 hypothetical protein APR51_35915 [Variovorax paradoxus]KPV30007.1 hypothetical protein APR47_24910 [Variovorax paradoxus]